MNIKALADFLWIGSVAFIFSCSGGNVYATVGATTPFTTYEAEGGTLGGGASVVSLTSAPTTEFSSPQLEASGHAYVQLTGTGQSVTWANNTGQSITAINVRASVPNNASGTGITTTLDLYVNGTFRQALTLSSTQTWVYETSSTYDGMSRDPTSGNPHVFFDETHTFITGAAVAPGDTITLQQDAANTASFYWIDCIDLEAPPAALTQPANSLSIISYGAVANDSTVDCTTPIQNCVNAAQSQKKIVWIPAGTFYLLSGAAINAKGITIEGAGPWYSTIYRDLPLPATNWSDIFICNSCVVQNFHVDANARSAAAGDGNATAVDQSGSNWVTNNIWVQHELGTWSGGNGGIIENCRISNSWGDGINLNNVQGGSVGNNLTANNNFIRGCGDDGIAINSVNYNGSMFYTQMQNITITNNTSVASWWAHQLGVYGGINDVVKNNLLTDSVKFTGLLVGEFGANGASLQSALIQGNTVLRGGGNCFNQRQAALAIGTVNAVPPYVGNIIVSGNTISNSTFGGVDFTTSFNTVLENNTITNPGSYGVAIDSIDQNATGNAVINNNTLTGLPAGQSSYKNYPPAGQFIIGGIGNAGFTIPGSLPSPWVGADIGSEAATGGDSYSGSTFTIVGSGADIGGASDAFHYVYQPVTGDCNITARINTEKATNPSSKAGIMIRNSLDPSDLNVAVVVTPANGILFQWRSTYGGTTSSTSIAGPTAPAWVHLTRSGNVFTAFYSSNGQGWSTIGSVTIPMASSVSLGFPITSDQDGSLCSAMIDNFGLTPLPGPLPSPWLDQDVGAVGVPGNAVYSNGTFTVAGSGADIWDVADAFGYVYQPISGDGSITARVATLQDINVWSKTGVMIRETLNAGSTHASMFVTPGNGVTFQSRTTTGGTSTQIQSVGLTAPYWVRVTRSGNNFTGYLSPDGEAWTQLGSTVISMATNAYIGLPVLSHDNTALCSVTFDNVTVLQAPPISTGLIARAGSTVGQIVVHWSTSSGAQTYGLQRSTAAGSGFQTIATINAPTIFYIDSDSTLAAGQTYYYQLSATNSVSTSAFSAIASATPYVPPSIVGWRYTHFGSAGLNPTLANGAADTADPANDGLSNLMKYALGLNPIANYMNSSPTGAPVVQLQAFGNASYITLTFTGMATDVTYTVQATSDLVNWSPIYTSSGSPPPGTITVQDTQSTNVAAQRFLRLQVTGP